MWVYTNVGVCIGGDQIRESHSEDVIHYSPFSLPPKTNKQTPEFFFKYVNYCEFEVQHTVDYIAGGKEISRYNQNIRSDYLAIALSALKCLKSLSV